MTLRPSSDNPLLPWIILVTLSLIWGSSFILIKKGLVSFDPLQVGTIRISFAALVMVPLALRYLKSVYRTGWKKFLLLGLVANFFPAIFFAIAETQLSSSLTGILNSLTPLNTLIIGAIVFNVAINKKQTIGLVIGFSGSVLLTFISEGGGLGEFNLFVLFVVAATLCYGTSANMVKSFFPDLNTRIITSLQMFSIGPFAIVYLFSSDFITVMSTGAEAWYSLGYLFLLGAVGTSLAVLMFNRLIQMTTAVFAASVTYLMPVVAVIWGFVDGENLFPLHFLGMALIIAGVYVVNRNK